MKSKILYFVLGIALLTGCKKSLNVASPYNQLTADKVFSDTTSATAAMVSTYAIFNVNIDPNFNKYFGVYTDELAYVGTSQPNIEYFQSKLSTANSNNLTLWTNLYFAIYQCNDIIVQLKTSALPPSKIVQLTGESKFLRAYAYFHLVNAYGRVPLLLTTDVNTNAKATQTDSITIYRQIVSDLKDAQSGLATGYIGAGKVRANKWAATALLAKVYLFQQQWADAEAQASAIINSGTYSPLEVPGNVFIANSKETILSFSTTNGFITDGPNLIPSSGIPAYPVTTTKVNSFEAGDLRKANWLKSTVVSGTTYYYPYKYHNRVANTTAPENLIAFRLGEQYLIRAEARAEQNNVNGAISDINVIRQRAGLTGLSIGISQTACLNAVFHEKQTELFAENGNRFLDLKRTGRLNGIMSAYKSTWLPTAMLLPIPQNEITYNSNLIQNLGY